MSFHRKGLLALTWLVAACGAKAPAPAPAPATTPAPAIRPSTPVQEAARPAGPAAAPRAGAEGVVRAATVEAAVALYHERDGAKGAERSHVVERIDLNADGREDALVLLRSRRYCSGLGCMLLVFERDASGYRMTSALRLGRTPLIAATTRTGGWLDLVAPMTTERAGMRLVRIRHAQHGYPSDVREMAMVPPDRDVDGRVLFSDD